MDPWWLGFFHGVIAGWLTWCLICGGIIYVCWINRAGVDQ